MAFKIKWTKRADKKFDKIIDYLSNEWGNQTTKAFVKRVYDFLDLLLCYPEIGSIENKKKNIRGFPISKHIIIFYRIKNSAIIILNFFDNRQRQSRKKLY